jgi:hypothetical protein
MLRALKNPAILWALVVAVACGIAIADEPAAIDFERDIRPLLVEHCATCHGPSAQKSGLRLDARSFAFAGGDSGPIIKPGDAAASELVRRVTSTGDDAMPPDGGRLAAEQIELLTRWVVEGANWPETDADRDAARDKRLEHWAWQPLRFVLPPQLETSDHPIDAFVDAKLQEHGLARSPEANRRVLIRRLSFDLLGMPPSPQDVADFEQDDQPLAYERLVERLLASPRYGERQARHWLDIAHYADTHGFERDQIRENAWRYRDYVIDAFNSDKPYGQFLTEQVAGDATAPQDPDAVIATGFLAAGPWDFVGQAETPSPTLKRAARADDLDDMVAQVMTATCGVTIHCARCHDHKFDPISQREYYSLTAVFAGVTRGDRDIVPGESEAITSHRDAYQKEIAKLRSELSRIKKSSLNLADIVGGGSGYGDGRRDWGIDHRTGKATSERRGNVDGIANQFQTVEHPLIDGIFVPNGADGAKVVISSTGLDVNDLPKTSGVAWDIVRHGPVNAQKTSKIDEIDYGIDPHSEIGIHANAGITFDLQPIREATGATDLVFETAVGYGGRPDNLDAVWADARIYCDGELAWEHRHLGPKSSTRLRLPIAAKTRFLTLVATDGGNDIGFDQVFFGDPTLRITGEGTKLSPEELKQVEEIERQIAVKQRQLDALPSKTQRVYAVVSQSPPKSYVFKRGNPETPLDEVAPGTIGCIKLLPSENPYASDEESLRRRALASWLTDESNPLPWRVIANRLWQHHFGVGLVDTPSDFGLGGGLPTHPELLDWLATELLSNDGSIKHLQRIICTSAAYRQQSTRHADGDAIDSSNRLLCRMNPRRIEGEALRDAVLAASGCLNLQAGGPGFRDFDYEEEYAPVYKYITPNRPELWRRSVYRFVVRTTTHRFLAALDCPDPASLTPTRNTTTTVVQSLALLNNDFMLDQAARMSQRIEAELPGDRNQQVCRAFADAFGRQPNSGEKAAAVKLVETSGLRELCRMLLNANEFVYVD